MHHASCKNEDDLKNEDNLKNKDDRKKEDAFENEDDVKNEDDLKNEDNLKNEDDHKNEDGLKNEEIELCMRHWACTHVQKRRLFRQGQLNHNEWGMVIMGLGATLPNHIPACRSEFNLNFWTTFF